MSDGQDRSRAHRPSDQPLGVGSEIVKTADAYYRPGSFTTFPAFEWTSNPSKRNLHRVVVFRDSQACRTSCCRRSTPRSRRISGRGWRRSARRVRTLLAIPHNANASDGLMFSLTDSNGKPLERRRTSRSARSNEPLYEISQIKGTSETIPDTVAERRVRGLRDSGTTRCRPMPSGRRTATAATRAARCSTASCFAAQGKGNPFKYGFIGDSDTHNAAATNEEYNYTGKFGFENDASHRLNGLPGQPPGQLQQMREFSSGGLAGVWAQENTRESIYDAMLRKETFGTSGTHIKVRFFGGWDFSDADVKGRDFVADRVRARRADGRRPRGRGNGQGAVVSWSGRMKDPNSGNLDRIQIVKGWVDASGARAREDLRRSLERRPQAAMPTGKLPAVGNTVDVAEGDLQQLIGRRGAVRASGRTRTSTRP